MSEKIPALKKETAQPRSRRGQRLIRLLIALAAILLIVLFFRSPLSKIGEIQVTGNEFVSREEIVGALDIAPGDSFFFPGISKLRQRANELKPIESVLIVKNFPGVVSVEVKEYPQVAVRLSTDGSISAILSNGLMLPMPKGKLPDKPILSGWKADDANMAELCKALGDLPGYLLSDLSEIQQDPSVSYPKRIKMFTRSRFEVTTSIELLKDKIAYLSDIVQNREPGKITMLDVDYYSPYSTEIVAE